MLKKINILDAISPYSKDETSKFVPLFIENIKGEKITNEEIFFDIMLASLKSERKRQIWQFIKFREEKGRASVEFPDYISTSSEIKGIIVERFNYLLTNYREKIQKSRFFNFRGGFYNANLDPSKVVPGITPNQIFIPYALRYVFSQRFCEGKVVIVTNCYSGYGAKILSKVAQEVYVLNSYSTWAAETYYSENIHFIDEYKTEKQFDVVLNFELFSNPQQSKVIENLERDSFFLSKNTYYLTAAPNKTVFQQYSLEFVPQYIAVDVNNFYNLLKSKFSTVDIYYQEQYSGIISNKACDNAEYFIGVCSNHSSI